MEFCSAIFGCLFIIKQRGRERQCRIEKPESRFSRQGPTFSPPLLDNSCLQVWYSAPFLFHPDVSLVGWSEDKKSPKLSSPLTFLATWPLFNLAIELLWCESGDDS